MIDYGPEPSQQLQMELPGFSDEGQELMADARRWVGIHYDEFMWYRNFARQQCAEAKDGKASPNFCLQSMRNRFHVSIPNAYAPCLARIAMEEEEHVENPVRFRLAKSKVDGFMKARTA